METFFSHLTGLYNNLLSLLDGLGVDTDRLADLLMYDSRQPLLFNTGLFLVIFSVFYARLPHAAPVACGQDAVHDTLLALLLL